MVKILFERKLSEQPTGSARERSCFCIQPLPLMPSESHKSLSAAPQCGVSPVCPERLVLEVLHARRCFAFCEF